MKSRTRPGGQPDDLVKMLRLLRRDTRGYVLTLEAVLKALTSDVVSDRPELLELRVALRVATGQRGEALGTPSGIERLLTQLLGEG